MLFNTMIDIHGKAAHFTRVEELFQLTKKYKFPKMTIIYNTLLNVYGLDKNYDRMDELVDEMHQADVKFDSVTWSTLVNAYGKGGRLEKMEDAFTKSQQEPRPPTGTEPSLTLYNWNSVLTAYRNVGMVEMAEKRFADLKAQGHSPDIVTYTIMLSVYQKAGLIQKAKDIVTAIRQNGFQLNARVYGELISSFRYASQMPEIDEIRDQMDSEGVAPTPRFYCTLINTYAKMDKNEKISAVMQEVQTNGYEQHPDLLNTFLIYYNSTRQFQQSKKIVETAMAAKPHEFKTSFFKEAIKCYAALDDFTAIEKLVRTLEDMGVKLDWRINSEISNAYMRAGKIDKSVEVKRSLKTGCMPANYIPLMLGYARAKNVPEMEEVWREMIAEGITPSVRNHLELVKAYYLAEAYDRIWPTYKSIVEQGFDINEYGLCTMIELLGLRPEPDFDHLVELLEEAKQKSIKFTAPVYQLLVKTYGNVGDVEKVDSFVQSMVKEGLPIDQKTILLLIDLFGRNEDVDRLMHLETLVKRSDLSSERMALLSLANQYAANGFMAKMQSTLRSLMEPEA
eukprot:NODE_923_length_1762_cov_24.556575_g866_i0.p1 GENE.NODE_923_length_1762_cov_24.556575_g866_i0~~NODE_923_length_1762_cov_24.556575_g866_i0.p1  ORF type:complete len:564 (-),score=166.47 NODE_923_length_1762_cov_24.556575_g866_i0:71-1762(-)